MPKVEKVTVSLPAALFAYVEDERARTGATRSETIATLLWQARHAAELVEREQQYARAYAERPETDAEREWGLAAADETFAGSGTEWDDVAPAPESGPRSQVLARAGTPRRPAKSQKGAPRAAR